MAECADTDLVERPESLAGGPDLAASRFILSVQMTREEFFAAWRGLMARRAGNWVLILVGGGIVAAGIAEPHIVLAVFGGIFLLCLLLNTFLLAPLQMWRRSDLRHGYDLDISPRRCDREGDADHINGWLESMDQLREVWRRLRLAS